MVKQGPPGPDEKGANGMRMWKVGEIAKRTGLTVRALHHYDQIGLVSPSHRTRAGHRLYGTGDLARLQQVLSLRQLGFSLEEIRDVLGRPDFSPRRVLELHIDRLRGRIEEQERLCRRLEALAARVGPADEISAEELIETMEAIVMFEKHYTPEQLKALEDRRALLGEDALRQAEAEWPELIAKVRAALEGGKDPASPEVQALARRWMELVQQFSGGDAGIERSAANLLREEPEARDRFGLDPRLFEYVGKAMAAAKG
jgi:MerR family transcriptional regulator, thiopeptide resistance regulator